ncbi:MAG: trypsin-like peptidase domain-containing protein [Mycobacterium sp.]|nr:trypsin-like peptidase domain-containing protein [Mycobacterium sp.]
MITRTLAVAGFVAVICAAVVLLIHPKAVGSQSVAADSAYNRPEPRALSIEQVAAKVLPSVVTLQIIQDGYPMRGSGVVLSADGLILTNNHVAALASNRPPPNSGNFTVIFNDGRIAPFNVIATDPKSDIAIGRAEHVSGLTPISVGSSAGLRIGQSVAAVGTPMGLRGTVTVGIVSALNRLVSPAASPGHESAAFYAIQTDAALNPGNSGGALVDMNGELVGINAAGQGAIPPSGSGAAYLGSVGLGFAIPVDHAVRIVAELLTTGRVSHGWLGAQASNDTNPYGAKIIKVMSGSPAAAAGLPVGAIVTKVDSQIIENGDMLLAALQSKDSGTPVTLAFTDSPRGPETVQVTLGADLGQP